MCRQLGTVLQVAVPPFLVAYLSSLHAPGEERPLEALPGDSEASAGGRPIPRGGGGGPAPVPGPAPPCPAPPRLLPLSFTTPPAHPLSPSPDPRTHAVDESTALLREQLRSVNPAVVLAAAEALLHLARMEGAPAGVLAALPQAAGAIVAAATNDEGQLAAAQPAVLALLLEHLPAVPAVQQPALFPVLLPLVAAVPQGSERTRALAGLWRAVLG